MFNPDVYSSEVRKLLRCPVCNINTEESGLHAEFKPVDEYGLAFRFCSLPHFLEFKEKHELELNDE